MVLLHPYIFLSFGVGMTPFFIACSRIELSNNHLFLIVRKKGKSVPVIHFWTGHTM